MNTERLTHKLIHGRALVLAVALLGGLALTLGLLWTLAGGATPVAAAPVPDYGADVSPSRMNAVAQAVPADPPTLTTQTTEVTYTEDSPPVLIDDSINVTDSMTSTLSLYGAKISIIGNFNPAEDRLGISGTASPPDTTNWVDGIEWNYDSSIGVLELGPGKATDPITKYQEILRRVVYSNTSQDPVSDTRTVRFHIIEHFYQRSAGTANWSAAKTAAASSVYSGLQGYLVTVMSADENDFIQNIAGTTDFIAATDQITEGRWIWATGPESAPLPATIQGGTQFWQGPAAGYAVNGHFQDWGSGEPNNLGGEDCGHHSSGGVNWNDIPCSRSYNYIIEYGGMPTDSHTTSGTVLINVQPVNDSPVATATADSYNINLGGSTDLHGSASDDPIDHDLPLSYHWDWTGPAGSSIASPSISETTFTGSNFNAGVVTITLTVTDTGGLTDTDFFTITVANVQVAGLDVTNDSTTTLGCTTYFTATIDKGSSVTYTWDFGDNTPPIVTTDIAHESHANHIYPIICVTTPITYTVVVTAQNAFEGDTYTSTDTTIVTITNEPPVADAGPPQMVVVDALVTLDGSGSYDPDRPCHAIVAYYWEQTGGVTATLSDNTAVSPTFTAPQALTMPTVLTFTLTITDDGCLTATAVTSVTVVLPVGGYTEPVSTLALLWPWVAPVAALGAGTVGIAAAVFKKRRERKHTD